MEKPKNSIVASSPFIPRKYQRDFVQAMEKKKRGVLCWARRHGKDLACWNFLIKKAWEKKGVYYYIFPEYSQARKALWDSITEDGIAYVDFVPKVMISKKWNHEMKISLLNGSIIQVIGSDNSDAIRGGNPCGVVFSEYAYQNPKIWEMIVDPILTKNGGWAVFNSCVIGNTLILTENGFERIKRDFPLGYSDIDEKIFGLGGFHTAEKYYRSIKRGTIIIETMRGYKIECTPEHPLWNGKEWIKAQNWKVGNFIPIQRNQQIFGKEIKSNWRCKKRKSFKDSWYNINEINEDFAYFLGLYLSEGSVRKNEVTITNFDKEIVECLSTKWFASNDGMGHNRIFSKELADFIFQSGLGLGAKNKTIPDFILHLPKKELSAFLSGYFDGDGTSYKGRISCCSASEKLMQDLQVILLNYGIVSTRKKILTPPTKKVKKSCISWRLELDGYNAYLFYTQIGFKILRKQDKKENLIGKATKFWNDFSNISKNKIIELGKKRSWLKRQNNITYYTLKDLCGNDIELKKVLTDNFYWDNIKSITNGEAEVYDFVIPETHSFFSNGFVSHNTPNGKNHFFDLYSYALANSEEWFASKITAEESKLISKEEIEKKLSQGFSEDILNQEWFCSFESGVVGSYYGKYIKNMEKEGRICYVPYDKNLLVYTAWDLGFSDATSIIFYQRRGNEILLIDCYENQGYHLSHYLDHLRQKDYVYGGHYIPFDGKMHDRTGTTFQDVARDLGYQMTVLPKERSIFEGIERVRGMFPRFFIDKTKCDYLMKCLIGYHAEYDEKAKVYKDVPKHDWTSHLSDALRYMTMAINQFTTTSMSKEKLDELKKEFQF